MFLKKNKCTLTGFAGISAAVIALLSAGGYLLHRKVLKCRLREQARKQAMNLAVFDMNDDDSFDDEGFYNYGDDDNPDEDDYIKNLMQDLKGDSGE
jgi:hypothetical protein